jgi:predicted nucleic acid-binding protein
MVIVSDASPIIALAVCGKLDLLEKLFDRVCIPRAVYNELSIPGKPEAERITKWAKDKVVPVKNTAAVTGLSLNLDAGESEALALYWETAADYVLIDEKRGRAIAAGSGIKTVGTAGILLWARQNGFISAVKPSLDILVENNFRISNILYRQILERAGERTTPQG